MFISKRAKQGMTKLLNIDANAKTVKGQKRGYMTAVMYLAPYTASGRNTCPMAEIAQCHEACLNTAGRGGIAKQGAIIATDGGTLPDNAVQRARLERTRMYWDEREGFLAQLVREIEAFIAKAERKGLTPVVRLNGTSDIQWERGHSVKRLDPGARALIQRTKGASLAREGRMLEQTHASIFEAFPEIQFYDYTKMPKRFNRKMPSNYHLSLSFSGASNDYAGLALEAHDAGAPLVVVVRDQESKEAKLARNGSAPRIDGDETDLRFTDPAGAYIVLKAKGKARKDTTGFVVS